MKYLKFGLAGGFTAACLLVACSGGNTIKPEPETSAKPSSSETPNTSGSDSGQAEAHNRIRSKHKLSPLKWSSSLASYAQEWANKLAASNNCNMEHRPNSGAFKQLHGENLYWASAKNWSDGRSEVQNISIKDAVDEWAKEESDYNYASNSCKPGKQCGHYTQVVWKDTKEVGCASKQCGDKSQVWVCNYSPGGNVVGQKPY